MKILVTGANGMLGQDLCPILEDNGHEVIEASRQNFDVTKAEMLKEFIAQNPIDLLIHCAAYTSVDDAENNFDLAFSVNASGTGNVAKICAMNDIPLVYISTDYIFDGTKDKPYLPNDKANPLNVYGQTKLKGEEFVKQICSKYYIVRTSWLYGHHGKNFVETMLNLKNKGSLKVVNDQRGCPTWTVDLSNAIVDLLNEPYGVYHLCGGGEASWYDFAKEIFELENIQINLIACNSDEYVRPAQRPKYSVLENEKRLRHWKKALKDYLLLRMEDGE